jgi:hypothetical protein
MTVDVSSQTAFVPLVIRGSAVASQTAYVPIFPGTRVTVTSQTAYLALFNVGGPPPTGRRRRVVNIISG